MSETEPAVVETSSEESSDNLKLLIYAATACSALALLVALISLLLILDMHGDVGATEEQSRRVVKLVRGLQDDLAELKVPGGKETHKAVAVEKKIEPPRPTHIDSAAPGQDCVVKPGDPKSFAECLKSGSLPR